MCILVLFYKHIPGYPLVLCANRDEYYDRPSAPPSVRRDKEDAVPYLAPRDLRAGGTWIGLNAHGALCAVTNRKSEPFNGTAPSRGLLCSSVLARGSSRSMVQDGLEKAGQANQSGFNLLLADGKHAYLLVGGGRRVTCMGLPPGIHVLTNAHDLNEIRFPTRETWAKRPRSEEDLLSRVFAQLKSHDPISPDGFAPCKHFENRGTRSATVIVLKDRFENSENLNVRYFFADGPPCSTPFTDWSDTAARMCMEKGRDV